MYQPGSTVNFRNNNYQVLCINIVTKEEGHTGFLHLPSAVLAVIFLARRIQLFLFLVDHDLE